MTERFKVPVICCQHPTTRRHNTIRMGSHCAQTTRTPNSYTTLSPYLIAGKDSGKDKK
ncbi:hypothetical protein [Adhaeribacter radiodurans]|uniref:Uncharacterized protein n=1 Tax=Adhaeribacter radiodurans TaxID=2745197 RepID=A0A7L7L1I8_9BACT|nr:hypothetical protein [Adhaeribacter radiodurans]QMU26630.1 hypothetical protein HUW48_23830 [Adhaeribacter radiodurans]